MGYPTSVKTFPTRANGQTITPAMFNDPDDEITGIEQGLLEGCEHLVLAEGFRLTDAATLTIASGAVTVLQGYNLIDTEASAATDDLVTITPGTPANGASIAEGSLLLVGPVSASRVVTMKSSGGNLVLLGGDYVMNNIACRMLLGFDGTNWVEIARSNAGTSGWTTPSYSAGDFTASSGTWTVGSGDVTTYSYVVNGKTMTVAINLVSTDVSATPTLLQVAIPGGYTSKRDVFGTGIVNDAGAGNAACFVRVSAGGTNILIQNLSGNFTAGSGTEVYGVITFEVN